ncbi:hypothetical protein MBENS4_4611 [Novosphingobium sp. MBES04]|nr:hypothetical protein MBENS4_4611 [Novosphingobium sp. MBES04]
MQIAISPDERRVRLLEGRAYFDVVHSQRPFIVETRGGETRDLGTRFVVEDAGGQTHVSLIEGEISVQAQARSAPVSLLPGETVGYDRNGTLSRITPSRGDPGDWTQGRLVFRDTRLAEVAEALSRYAPRPIVPAQAPEIQNRRVTGTFLIRDKSNFASALCEALDLRLVESPDGVDLLVAI